MIAEPLFSVADVWVLLFVTIAVLLVSSAVVLVLEMRGAAMVDQHGRVLVHACPPDGSGGPGVMPCCGRTPLEVPRDERVTQYGPLVTCGGAR